MVGLIVALSIPATGPDGQPYAERGLILLAATFVILGSSLLQGLTLNAVLRRADLGDAEQERREEEDARRVLRGEDDRLLDVVRDEDQRHRPQPRDAAGNGKQRRRDLAGDDVDLVRGGRGDQQVGVAGACAVEHLGVAGVAHHALDVERVVGLLDQAVVVVDEHDVVALARELPGDLPADLPRTADDDPHGPVPR